LLLLVIIVVIVVIVVVVIVVVVVRAPIAATAMLNAQTAAADAQVENLGRLGRAKLGAGVGGGRATGCGGGGARTIACRDRAELLDERVHGDRAALARQEKQHTLAER